MLKELERLTMNPTVVAAVLAGIATFGASYITSRYSEDQLEANLIMEAVKVCKPDQRDANLRALMDADFLPNHKDKLDAAIKGHRFDKMIPPPGCP